MIPILALAAFTFSMTHTSGTMNHNDYGAVGARMEDTRQRILGHIEKHSQDLMILERKLNNMQVVPPPIQLTVFAQKERFEAAKGRYDQAIDIWKKAGPQPHPGNMRTCRKAERLLDQVWAELTIFSFECILP